jgi:C-terminal processing protease CtpA/Prc
MLIASILLSCVAGQRCRRTHDSTHNVDGGDVDSVSLDDVDELIHGRVGPKGHITVRQPVLGKDGLDLGRVQVGERDRVTAGQSAGPAARIA